LPFDRPYAYKEELGTSKGLVTSVCAKLELQYSATKSAAIVVNFICAQSEGKDLTASE
jgi:hypothetical protein